jgi:hypothetical protein
VIPRSITFELLSDVLLVGGRGAGRRQKVPAELKNKFGFYNLLTEFSVEGVPVQLKSGKNVGGLRGFTADHLK